MVRFFRISILLAIATLLFSCSGKENDSVVAEAPVLVSVNPANGSTDIEGSSVVVSFSFDQNVKCPLDKRSGITVAPEATISAVTAVSGKVQVSLDGLVPSTSYTLTLAKGVVTGFKQNQQAADAISYSFTTAAAKPEPQPDVHYELNPVKQLTNPNATAQAKKVYSFLLEHSGKHTLTGVQSEDTANNNKHVDLIATKTGKHPALAGYDFIFLQYSPTPSNYSWVVNYSDMSAPIEHWNNGGIVTYMWHWNVPNSKEAWEAGQNKYDFSGYNFYSDKTTFSITEALKEGTWQHDFIMKDLEKAAGYLKILQDAGVPVIWRPLHEAAGNYNLYGKTNNAWFWWGRGGADACKQLYRLIRDTFEKKYGLNNLIWVWTLDVNQQAKDEWADWYPGDDYVDIVGCDIYEENTASKPNHYQACVDLSKGNKLVAITECGNIPDPEKCYTDGQKWSWFLVWSSTSYALNTETYWKQIMLGNHILCRESMPSLR